MQLHDGIKKNAKKLSFFFKIFFSIILLAPKTFYGGQAVLNGVMMKGKYNYAIAVNTSSGIKQKTFPYKATIHKYKWLNVPIIRGMVTLVDMMIIGNKSLSYSADQALLDEEEQEKAKHLDMTSLDDIELVDDISLAKKNSSVLVETKKKSSTSLMFAMIFAMIFSTALALLLFKVAPLATATYLNNVVPIPTFLFNIVVGLTKLSIFVLYILAISQYSDIKELFRYHGAEHKTIHCHEAGETMSSAKISSFSRIHLRCGTTFIFVIILFTILLTLFIPKEMPFVTSLLLRISLLPLIIGFAYEFQRLAARTNLFVFKLFMYPGLWLQQLTTRNPQPTHISTGRTALKAALVADVHTKK